MHLHRIPYLFMLILFCFVDLDSGGAFVMQNADPITDRGDYAHNFDESGLIRGRIVEES